MEKENGEWSWCRGGGAENKKITFIFQNEPFLLLTGYLEFHFRSQGKSGKNQGIPSWKKSGNPAWVYHTASQFSYIFIIKQLFLSCSLFQSWLCLFLQVAFKTLAEKFAVLSYFYMGEEKVLPEVISNIVDFCDLFIQGWVKADILGDKFWGKP